MKVLVACEFSGIVRDAFRKRGHETVSCDLLPTYKPGPHYQGDVFDIIDDGWDLMIAHPPCTYLTVTGNRWFRPEYKDRFPDRFEQREEAVDFFMRLAKIDIPKICIENPVGIISTRWRKPDQYIQPYQFGHPTSKKTGLWLKNLPLLQPTNIVEPTDLYEYKNGKNKKTKDPKWHYKSINMPPSERQRVRSITFQGIADAMAEQWGSRK